MRLAAGRGLACVLGLALLAASPLPAQDPPESSEDETAEAVRQRTEERRAVLPELDVYLPDGQLDLRLSRLVKDAFFEGQLKYDFVDGDIAAFLRYRYYGYRHVYQLSVFDTVQFDDLEDFENDFERLRGVVFLVERPHDFNHRTIYLAEVDRLTTSKQDLRFVNDRTNTFLRAGFQRGTPDDERSNAIVGESRARVETIFTRYKAVGPGGFGLTGALTYGFDLLGADFHYAKLQVAALKRVELGGDLFAIGRLDAGTFPFKERREDLDPDVPQVDRYSLPRIETFKLGGRENLKGVDQEVRGTEKLQATAELFVPWFEEQSRRAFWLDWTNFYWIGYAGTGTAGFESDVYTDWDRWYVDVGFGFEASFRLYDFDIFISGIVAEAVQNSTGLETHFSIKSYH